MSRSDRTLAVDEHPHAKHGRRLESIARKPSNIDRGLTPTAVGVSGFSRNRFVYAQLVPLSQFPHHAARFQPDCSEATLVPNLFATICRNSTLRFYIGSNRVLAPPEEKGRWLPYRHPSLYWRKVGKPDSSDVLSQGLERFRYG